MLWFETNAGKFAGIHCTDHQMFYYHESLVAL